MSNLSCCFMPMANPPMVGVAPYSNPNPWYPVPVPTLLNKQEVKNKKIESKKKNVSGK